jgi:hypothetical protein
MVQQIKQDAEGLWLNRKLFTRLDQTELSLANLNG